MLILLPPSETKRSGGVGISIDKLAIIWAAKPMMEGRASVSLMRIAPLACPEAVDPNVLGIFVAPGG